MHLDQINNAATIPEHLSLFFKYAQLLRAGKSQNRPGKPENFHSIKHLHIAAAEFRNITQIFQTHDTVLESYNNLVCTTLLCQIIGNQRHGLEMLVITTLHPWYALFQTL